MKSMILVVCAFVAIAAAAPASDVAKVPETISSEFEQKPDGSYNFGFETDNQIKRTEVGELKEVLDEDNKPQVVVAVRGSYVYLDQEGHTVEVKYFADESGYHAEGDSIPKVARR